MDAEEVAEAVFLAFAAAKRHLEEEISLKAALYQISRAHKPRTRALRLARKLLYFYAINNYWARDLLERLIEDEIRDDSKLLLSLILCSIKSGIDLGDSEELVRALRRIMKGLWPSDIEPWIGLLRSFHHLERISPAPSRYQPWLIRMLYRVLGRAEAHKLMKFQDENEPRTYVMLNTLLASPEDILEEADRSGVKLIKDGRLPGVYLLEEAEDTRKLVSMIRRSLLLVQDFSSCYAVHAADPKPGQRVLDVCAAPGSKTILAGIKMRNKGLIISVDSSISRIRTHLRRVRKAGLKIVEDLAADATTNLPLTLQADLVILDPPCSSTGLLWREPTYRQIVKPRHVKMFARLQAKMLEVSARHVRVGGSLAYSTCSISLAENELLIEDFLRRHPEFRLSEIDPRLGSNGLRGMQEARRLYPHRDYCNGFFIAKLQRRW